MDADGWRKRKRKADTPASDLVTARARAEVLDVQHAEKKFKAARARKLGKGADTVAGAGAGTGAGAGSGTAAGSVATDSTPPAKRAKPAHAPGPPLQLEQGKVETKATSPSLAKCPACKYTFVSTTKWCDVFFNVTWHVSDWAELDAFFANKLWSTTLVHCHVHSSPGPLADRDPCDDTADDQDMEDDLERALFLSQPLSCQGCDSKMTYAGVTGRGQLQVTIVKPAGATAGTGAGAGAGSTPNLPTLKFYVNRVMFPLPSAATIYSPPVNDDVYEFGNACESCCKQIQARADAATEASGVILVLTTDVLCSFRWPRALTTVVLGYMCFIRLASSQCTWEMCL